MNRSLRALALLTMLVAAPAWADFTIPTGQWTVLTSSDSPSFRAYGSICWDTHSRRLWYYAGFPGDANSLDSGVNNTALWSFNPDTSAWTKVWDDGTAIRPKDGGTGAPRRRHSYGHFDCMEDRASILMHGGISHPGNLGHQEDTWEWSTVTNAWTQRVGVPGAYAGNRVEAETVYHPGLGKAVVFGGLSNPSSITPFLYDPAAETWTSLGANTDICPIQWSNGQMIYDRRRDRVVLFGGTCDYESLSLAKQDMWVLNTGTGRWTVVPVTGSKPAPRQRTSFGYDSIHDLYLVYGGSAQGGFANDTWVFNPSNYAKTFSGVTYPANGWVNRTSAVGQPTNSCSEWGLQFSEDHNAFFMMQGTGSNECFGQGQTHKLYALRLASERSNYLTFDAGNDRTLPGWCYDATARFEDAAGFQEGTCTQSPTGLETNRWLHVFPWDFNQGRDWQYPEIATDKTALGSSSALKVTVTGHGVGGTSNDCVNGATITSKEDALANPGNVGSGTCGQPYLYFRRNGNQFNEATGHNRLSLYLYVPAGWSEAQDQGGISQFDFQFVQNHCNPSQNPCRPENPSWQGISEGEPADGSNGHFYHYVKTPRGGGWYHVELDPCPQFLRTEPPWWNALTNQCDPTQQNGSWNAHYFDTLALMYLDGTSNAFGGGGAVNTPYPVYVDEIHFRREPLQENTSTVRSVSVGFLPQGSGTWWLAFYGEAGNPGGTWEVRWATFPVTNATWAQATPVTAIGAQSVPGAPGRTRKQRTSAGYGSVGINFDLPAAQEQPGARVYFGIKDVSQTGQHAITGFGPDTRTSSNPNVRSIGYVVPVAQGGGGPTPPTAPQGLAVAP